MRRPVLAALVAVVALLAGCERTADPDIPTAGGGTGPSPSASRDILGEMRRWAQCMREHGVDMPDPYQDPESGKLTFGYEGPGKGEPGADVHLAAQQACLEYETYQYQEFDPQPLSEEQLRLYREWARCLRDHGVDQSDPGPYGFLGDDGDEPPARDAGAAPDPQVVAREQAEAACMDKFIAARTAA